MSIDRDDSPRITEMPALTERLRLLSHAGACTGAQISESLQPWCVQTLPNYVADNNLLPLRLCA